MSELPEIPTITDTPTNFEEASERSKSHKTENIRLSDTPERIICARPG